MSQDLTSTEKWIEIPDENIRSIWKSKDGETTAYISTSWYQENGTPMDDEGDDITPLVTSSEKLRKIINKAGYKNDFTAEERNLWNGIFNVVNEKFSVNK